MEDTTSRRGAFKAFAGFLASLPVLGGLAVAVRSFLSPAHADKPEKLPLCTLGDVPESGLLPRTVSYHVRRGPAVESVTKIVFLTRDSGEVIALSGTCTHAGCPVVHDPDSDDRPLLCPCHDGAFAATGEVLDGPPDRPLPRLRIEVPETDDETIYLVEV